MYRIHIVLLTLFLSAFSLCQGESHLMRFADVSRDQIVFTYEDDLWLVPLEGGSARRITRSDGTEIFAKFSPDGFKIAFTANYDGGSDVYMMDCQGGEPVRLTYHPAADLVLDWFPDGEHVLFRSTREYPDRAQCLYKVSIRGGMPEKLPLDRAGLASLSPDGSAVVYNRISREFRHWKRHEGGTGQDLWMGSWDKADFKRITDFEGTDNFPMWHGDAVYFTSDRALGTLNLFKYDLKSGAITQQTFYDDYDVKYPSLGDNHIVYQYKETLYLLDLSTGMSDVVNVEIPTDSALTRADYIEAEQYAGGFGLSPKGKRAIIDIRGEIINIPVEEGVIYNLTRSSGVREKNPAWSPDGQKVVYLSDRTGEEELYLSDPKGETEPRALTHGGSGFRERPLWSPDSRYLLFHDKFMQLNLVDAESGEISVVDRGEYDDGWYNWGIQDYCWSPDSRWVAFAKLEQSLYQSIFLYSLDTKEIHRVTDPMTEDWSPSFSRDGKYLYFLSNRTFEPIMGFVDQNHIFLKMAKPYLLILEEGVPSPFVPKNVFDGGDEAKEESDSHDVVITLSDFEKRILAAPVHAGNLFRLEAVKGGFLYLEKTEDEFLKYQYVADDNGAANLNLHRFTLKDGEDSSLMEGIGQYHLSADGESLIYKARSSYGVVKVGKAKVGDGRLDLKSVRILVDKKEEFLQIFNEAWRVQRDWFYDPNMHGLNWVKTGEMYRWLVPFCGTRADLNYLIGEMIAELNVGHTYINGGDLPRIARVNTGLLGATFVNDAGGFVKIDRIIPADNWDDDAGSPLFGPGCPIRTGHYILAVDGVPIAAGDNIYKYLQGKGGAVVELTYNSKPDMEGAERYTVETVRSERTLRYKEWVRNNRNYVEEQSQGTIGYIHLPGMMENGLIEFAKAFYPQYYKKGLIIDARYNGGGFTSKQIIDRLERKINTMDQPREGKPSPTPERTFGGHLVLLINSDTGSDGEIFSEAWKLRGFGPVIGHRTWGGAVGIEAHQPLVDGAVTTPPQFGHYDLSGRWSIEGHGVDPDIPVTNMPGEVLQGKDAQLEKGLEVLQGLIAEHPPVLPEHPAYPDKSKPTLK